MFYFSGDEERSRFDVRLSKFARRRINKRLKLFKKRAKKRLNRDEGFIKKIFFWRRKRRVFNNYNTQKNIKVGFIKRAFTTVFSIRYLIKFTVAAAIVAIIVLIYNNNRHSSDSYSSSEYSDYNVESSDKIIDQDFETPKFTYKENQRDLDNKSLDNIDLSDRNLDNNEEFLIKTSNLDEENYKEEQTSADIRSIIEAKKDMQDSENNLQYNKNLQDNQDSQNSVESYTLMEFPFYIKDIKFDISIGLNNIKIERDGELVALIPFDSRLEKAVEIDKKKSKIICSSKILKHKGLAITIKSKSKSNEKIEITIENFLDIKSKILESFKRDNEIKELEESKVRV